MLLADETLRHSFVLSDARVYLVDPFLAPEEAGAFFDALLRGIRWRQDTIKLWGKVHDVPRLQQWFADEGMVYTWSGIRMEPEPWSASLERLRARLQEALGLRFNTALANLYRDGNDTSPVRSMISSLGWRNTELACSASRAPAATSPAAEGEVEPATA